MSQVESYRGRHADLYDVFYGSKQYADEAKVVHELLQSRGCRANGSLLELACGTGRHARELAKLGYSVTGLDYSKDMIRVARAKSAEFAALSFQHGDMRQLSFEARTFDASFCLFDSIGYLIDNQSILSCMRETHRVLKPGGTFLFEFWHAPAMLRSFEPKRVRNFQLAHSSIERTSTTQLDPVPQTATVQYKIRELSPSGACLDEFDESQTNRFFQCQEISLFLEAAGFENVEFLPAFSPGEPIDLDTWHVLAIATRPR